MSSSTSSCGGGSFSPDGCSTYFYSCTEVSPSCPVQATVLGYYPNLGANAALAAGFAGCALATLAIGIWTKTGWTYTAAVVLGCLMEVLGYFGRIRLHANPWATPWFELQMIVIVVAPALLCMSIYLTLKHVCLSIHPGLSRVPPKLYPLLFVPMDVFCIAVQGVGGALAAVAAQHRERDLLRRGNRTIVAGIALQVAVLGLFGALSAEYSWRAWRYVRTVEREGGGFRGRLVTDREGGVDCGGGRGGGDGSERRERDLWSEQQEQLLLLQLQQRQRSGEDALAAWRDGKLRFFCWAVAFAYLGILVRCTYRIVEMAGGWGNKVMRDEVSFIVLEGFMILLPAIALTAFQPGLFFPSMARRMRAQLNDRLVLRRGDWKTHSREPPKAPTESK